VQSLQIPIQKKCAGVNGFRYNPEQQNFQIDRKIERTWAPTLVGGDPADEFSILPALPDGMIFDKSTGIISGTPAKITDLVPYTVSAKNRGGVMHTKIACEIMPKHDGDIVEKIIACTACEELTEFEEIVTQEKNDKKPFNWMIWMVHRAHLNDPTLKKFDFTNLKMPSGIEEPLISPKLAVALESNDQIEELLLPSTNLQNPEAAIMAVSLSKNTSVKIFNIDSNALRPLELESVCHGLAESKTVEQFRCNNVAQGRQVLEALEKLVKANTFITRLGFELKDPHFRNVIDTQIRRNGDEARKRRVAAKAAAAAAGAS